MCLLFVKVDFFFCVRTLKVANFFFQDILFQFSVMRSIHYYDSLLKFEILFTCYGHIDSLCHSQIHHTLKCVVCLLFLATGATPKYIGGVNIFISIKVKKITDD